MLDKHIYYVPTESRAADWKRRSGDLLCIIHCIISRILMISCIMYYTVLLFIMYCICIMYVYTLHNRIEKVVLGCVGVGELASEVQLVGRDTEEWGGWDGWEECTFDE